MIDRDWNTYEALPLPEVAGPQFIQLDFEKPFTARSLMVAGGPGRNIQHGELQVSDDGVNFKRVIPFVIPHVEMRHSILERSFAPVSGRSFRLLFTKGDPGTTQITISEIELSGGQRLEGWARKAGYMYPGFAIEKKSGGSEAGSVIARDNMINLSASLAADGTLNWEVPEGEWTILRIGHTPTGATNRPGTPEATGLECDKLSREAVRAFWDGGVQPLLDEVKPWVGKTVRHLLVDSWEVGCQNWTDGFAAEFEKRRGYDPLPFLPAVSGRLVDGVEASERFLADFRITIHELLAENYYGEMQRLCHERGLELHAEPYGNGLFNPLSLGRFIDVPMGEFWVGDQTHTRGNKLSSSLANTGGRSVVAAEAFTASGDAAGWRNHPYSLKPLGDAAFAQGVNRFVFHRYAHQPWLDRKPGMTMGPHGLHFERTVTWWDQSPEWLDYLSRCQFLLQQGRMHADICYALTYCPPDDAPKRDQLKPAPPAGYDYDMAAADFLLDQLVFANGRLALPSGASYRMLVLPDSSGLQRKSLERLRDLARAGALVVVPETTRTEDPIVQELRGAGLVHRGDDLTELLGSAGVKPDFEVLSKVLPAAIRHIHRQTADAHIYFVANPSEEPFEALCAFRVAGRQPEIWHPENGHITPAALHEQADGRTVMPLRFGPAESFFVVFRKPLTAPHLVGVRDERDASLRVEMTASGEIEATISRNGEHRLKDSMGRPHELSVTGIPAPIELGGSWKLAFPAGKGAPESAEFDSLISWTAHPDPGIRYFSGTASYIKSFDLPAGALATGRVIELDLGVVKHLAEVFLNGKKLATLWKPPFRVGLTDAALEGANKLEVRVVNLWPNRLIGDEQLPPDAEWVKVRKFNGYGLKEWPQWLMEGKSSPTGRVTFATWRHYDKDSPLIESGLLGPVRVEFSEKRKILPAAP